MKVQCGSNVSYIFFSPAWAPYKGSYHQYSCLELSNFTSRVHVLYMVVKQLTSIDYFSKLFDQTQSFNSRGETHCI